MYNYQFMGMYINELLHPKITRLIKRYNVYQSVQQVELDRLGFETAEIFITNNSDWYSLLIHNDTHTLTIDHIKGTYYILNEFVLNTETHMWDKINEEHISLTNQEVKLYQ